MDKGTEIDTRQYSEFESPYLTGRLEKWVLGMSELQTEVALGLVLI